MKSKNKILLCAPYGGVPGGISRWTAHIKNYYEAQPQPKPNMRIVAMGRSMFVNAGSSLWFRLSSAWKDYRAIFREFYRQMREFSPEVVHLTSSASLSLFKDVVLLRRAHRGGAKTVIHFHFGRIPELAVKRNWEWRMLCRVIRLADKTIVIDRKSLETLQDEGFDTVVYLPNPVSPEVEQIVGRSSVARQPRKMIYAGHVVRTKGVFELVEACCDIPDVRLTLVGRPMDGVADKLYELARRKGSVEWLEIQGEQPYEKVIEQMLSAAAFVLPSYTEGFPNVILEAMACACPIVATSVGAIPEMLADGAGLVVEPQAVEPLRGAILGLLDSPENAQAMGRVAAERVRQMYSMPVVWKQLNEIWSSVV